MHKKVIALTGGFMIGNLEEIDDIIPENKKLRELPQRLCQR